MTHWQPPDLDEVRPDRFVINNDKLRPLLKGEGVAVGRFFELGTWRREGLIARLRERSFNVRTLQDRVAALPRIHDVGPPGAEAIRTVAPRERIAVFDPATLHWRDVREVDHGGKPAVQVRANVALRRRKSRGRPDYYISMLARDGAINLLPAKETHALIHAYSQIAMSGSSATLTATSGEDPFYLPQRQAILPPPHMELLDMLAIEDAERWTFSASVAPLLEAVLDSLGLALRYPRA